MSDTIPLGKDLLTGREIEVEIAAFASTHTHVMGRSGYGKTSLLKRITRDLIRAGCGVLVLDGKNELADDVIDTAAHYKLGDRSVVLDPKLEWTVGMNYLEPLGRAEPSELASSRSRRSKSSSTKRPSTRPGSRNGGRQRFCR